MFKKTNMEKPRQKISKDSSFLTLLDYYGIKFHNPAMHGKEVYLGYFEDEVTEDLSNKFEKGIPIMLDIKKLFECRKRIMNLIHQVIIK